MSATKLLYEAVVIYHNAMPGSMMDGYTEDNVMSPVYVYASPSPGADSGHLMEVLNRAWMLFNADADESMIPDPHDLAIAVGYRLLRLRSLSIGDVVQVADLLPMAVTTMGWRQISPATMNIVPRDWPPMPRPYGQESVFAPVTLSAEAEEGYRQEQADTTTEPTHD